MTPARTTIDGLLRERIHPSPATAPNAWLLRAAILLLVLGTVTYVERDAFHQDDSIVQPAIEVTCVVLGTALALGTAFYYRTRVSFGWPYVLFLLTLTIAVAFSPRSWNPGLSAARGALLIMESASVVALSRTFGLTRFVRCVVTSYMALILFGLALALIAPEDFPAFLRDRGEEVTRLRLHLFRLHPISLADDCAIALVLSTLLHGRWMRVCRVVLATCLILTVGRASIALGLPIYLAAELACAGKLRLRQVNVIGFLVSIPATLGVGLLFAYSDLAVVEQARTSLSQVMNATENDSTLSGRTLLWTMLVEDLSSDNIYGYGVGGARYYMRTVNPWFGHAHNSVLETVYTAGYLGAVLIVAALIGALFRLLSNYRVREARILIAALCYVIGAGMMNPSWYETSSLIVITIACGAQWSALRAPQPSPIAAWEPARV